MKEYRRRFIVLNLTMIGIVLLCVMIGVAVYMYWDYCDDLENTMEQMVKPMALSPGMDNPPSGTGRPSSRPGDRPQKVQIEEARQKDIMTVFYTAETGHYSIRSHIDLIDEETLAEVLEAVMAQESSFGTLDGYGLVYYRSGRTAPYQIALTSTGYIGSSMRQLILILACIWLGAMLCFFLLAYYLSALAVRPLEKSMRREKQFITDISHDLNTPVSVILANNRILKENPQAAIESQLRWIEGTELSANQMRTLISEMLTLAEAENTETALVRTTVDLSSLATKTALQMDSVAYDRGVTLETDIAEGVTLLSNETYLLRIMTGLLENAIKYEPRGGTVCLSVTAEKRRIKCAVRNKNSVIAPEDLPHVFERFYRADHSRRQDGHGLGLSIVKQMTQRLGGKIRVESSVGTGTVFLITFS